MSAVLAKSPRVRLIPIFSHAFAVTHNLRSIHNRLKYAVIPAQTPFVPDVTTFLSLIGRNLSQHAAKIPSWTALFSLTSTQFKQLGIDPPRSRKYLLRWREKFRRGQFGVGGDFKYVRDGIGEVQALESESPQKSLLTATLPLQSRKTVVNAPVVQQAGERPTSIYYPVKSLRVRGAYTIIGHHAIPLKGGRSAKVVQKEGLWEDRRGHKIDGGERRQAEVRAKQRGGEKRAVR